ERAVGRVAGHAVVAVGGKRAIVLGKQSGGVVEHRGVACRYAGAAATRGKAVKVSGHFGLVDDEPGIRPGARRDNAILGVARYHAVADGRADGTAGPAVADNAETVAGDLTVVDRHLGGYAGR